MQWLKASWMNSGQGNPCLTHLKQLPYKLGHRIPSLVVDTCGIFKHEIKTFLFNTIAHLNIFGMKQWFNPSCLLIGFSGNSHVERSGIKVS